VDLDERQFMSIWTPPGSKIKYINPAHGWERDREKVAEILLYDEVYTISKIIVYHMTTNIYLHEEPGRQFNSNYFANVDEIPVDVLNEREHRWHRDFLCGEAF